MNYTIREFQESDYEASIKLHNLVFPDDQTTVEEIRQFDRMRQPKHFLRHLIIIDNSSGKLIAQGRVGHGVVQFNPDSLFIRISVHPDFRRSGIGMELYKRLEKLWPESGATRLRTEIKEDNGAGLAFLKKFEFKEDHRIFESRLDLSQINFSLFKDPQTEMTKHGIALTTLEAEIRGDSFVAAFQKIKKIFELANRCIADIPSPDEPQPLSLEAFFTIFIDSELAVLDGIQLAKDGDRYVGLSIVSKSPRDSELRQRLTGVLPEYRRKGIALALKLRGIAYAQSTGAHLIKTSNDTVNTGMLAINKRLGFEPEPSWIIFEKQIK